jgi:hypothetical protein
VDAVIEVELGQDAGDVVGDCVRAERALARDVLIALATGEAAEDLEFAFGQGAWIALAALSLVVVIGMSRSRMRCSSFLATGARESGCRRCQIRGRAGLGSAPESPYARIVSGMSRGSDRSARGSIASSSSVISATRDGRRSQYLTACEIQRGRFRPFSRFAAARSLPPPAIRMSFLRPVIDARPA